MTVFTPDPDFAVIDRVLAGEEETFAILVERHKRFAYTIAHKVIGNTQEAEEAAQDAFVKAYRSLPKFGKQSKFSTWLYRIVFNTAISYKRKNKPHVTSIDEARRVHADSDTTMESEERVRHLEAALNHINEADRTALVLFYLKELSMEEIASITGQNVNTLKVRIHRARQRLARELKLILKEEALTL